MNKTARIVQRQYVPGGEGQIGTWIKTKRYEQRVHWEILEHFDKKTMVEVEDKEATANQE